MTAAERERQDRASANGSHPAVLPPGWTADEALAMLEKYEGPATLLTAAAEPLRPFLEYMLWVRKRKTILEERVRALYDSGEPLPPELAEYRELHEAHHRAKVGEKKAELAIAQQARRELAAEGWQEPPGTASLAAELARPRETVQHRIPDLAGWNHNVLLAGPRKVGKTQLEVNLAAGLSLSRHGAPGVFLGQAGCLMAGNVACVNAEMDADDWRDCFRALPPGSCDPARIRPLHCRGIPLPVITSEAARDWFTGWLRKEEIEVLIIDTWGAFCAKNGVRNFNDDAEARVITDALDEIKRNTWVASIIVLIHMPHQNGDRHLERFKGAGAVGDWADVLGLTSRTATAPGICRPAAGPGSTRRSGRCPMTTPPGCCAGA